MFPKVETFCLADSFGKSTSNKKNLRSRGIKCDTQCQMCGADEEYVNHVLFECPLALQTWVISNIPSCSGVFPTQSVFTNMDYLFWRLPKEPYLSYFPWILWCIWKNRNDKIYNNKTRTPFDMLRSVEIEGALWAEAQIKESTIQDSYTSMGTQIVHGAARCYIDGEWKEHEFFTGQ